MQLAVGCFVNTRRGKREGGRKEEISSFQPVSVWFSFEEKNLKKKKKTRALPRRERKAKRKIRVVHDSVICKVCVPPLG
jgi:hypothetical protein